MHPVVASHYPVACARARATSTADACGAAPGWTGQPNVIVSDDGDIEVRFNAYDGAYQFLDAETGEPVREKLQTGDLAKGSASSDPDGYPLYYAGSRDNATPARAAEAVSLDLGGCMSRRGRCSTGGLGRDARRSRLR